MSPELVWITCGITINEMKEKYSSIEIMQKKVLYLINSLIREVKIYGMKRTIKKFLFFRLFHFSDDFWYYRWIAGNERINGFFFKKKKDYSIFSIQPKISILMPVWRTDPRWLEKAIISVTCQSYRNWELCIVYAGPHDPAVCELLSRVAGSDQRVRLKYIDKNEGISGNTNFALEMASGEFTGFLDQDDELAPDALYKVVDHLNRHNGINLIYSDHDIIDTTGRRKNPYFKPDFSLPFLFSGNYFLHFVICKTAILQQIGGIRAGFEGAQDYDLNLRLIENISRESISHIGKVLYHWRSLATSCALDVSRKPLSSQAGKSALEDYLKRNNIHGDVIPLPFNTYRVRFSPVDSRAEILLFLWPDQAEGSGDRQAVRKLVEWIDSQKIPCVMPGQYAASCTKIRPGICYEGEIRNALIAAVRDYSPDFVIVVQEPPGNSLPVSLSDRWIDELVGLYSVFPAGVVGCGAPVFHDVLCSVPFPCGPLFCVRRSLLEEYLDSGGGVSDFPGFQRDISRFAEESGFENISTPFCMQVRRDPDLLFDYYHHVKEHRFFTSNMRYYLKLVFFD